ncbi:MAG: transposase [Okeania sp. SIO2C9]|uniref:RNA-guided endonuclease InsQ/TnpB family protein n=1 Tax=Okeania sp. SIO2C9 TaxID=2607791 RepID=UPI0013C1DEEF|nr:transposase [Okeania sp. SIO2C9]NEQ73451.1 transposase [Okeania sp. SIO2C9]
MKTSGKPIELNGWSHKLPFIGIVKTYEPIEATTKKNTISRQSGEWYLSLGFEFHPNTKPKKTDVIGVDLGVKTLATLSNGKVFSSIKPYHKAQKKLAKLQRQLSRKVKHSNNWYKAVIRLARQHGRVANIRKDALNKLTTYLAKNHGTVVIEDLTYSRRCPYGTTRDSSVWETLTAV